MPTSTSRSMLSILIPIYAYDVGELVQTLHQQALALSCPWEIRLLDDASPLEWQQKNRSLVELAQVHYRELPANIGRAKIRNLLGQEAQYDYLLFLDSDSEISKDDFLATYVQRFAPRRVLCGGRSYEAQPREHSFTLHWWYGNQREVRTASLRAASPYAGFMTNNFVVPKAVLQDIPFDETILTYGHEDTLFGYQLQEGKVEILHLDNPVIHIGLDESARWLSKQEQAIHNLYALHEQYPFLQTKALQWWLRLRKAGVLKLVYPLLIKNVSYFKKRLLNQSRPNLRILDLLKIIWLEEIYQQGQ